ncbi:methyl-accepting chemotaxis protein [Pseudomonas sp. 13B_2.1_Bac1]|nr:methyl-accepting chemotaxis protein [Pseudomonas sp. 13B_2.1_Bac1]MCU1785305.1 methyl-accepting chemotaxis protein [Pseudomonas sp. 13B_2.1_Bac1]
MKLTLRTLLCFALISALLVAMGAFFLTRMNDIRHAGQVIQTESMPNMALSDELGLNLSRLRITALLLHAFNSPQDLIKYSGNMNALTLKIENNLAQYSNIATTDEERTALSKLKDAYQTYREGMLEEIELLKANRQSDVVLQLRKLNEYANLMNEQTAGLAAINQRAAIEAGSVAEQTYSQARSIAIGATIAALLITLTLAWRFSRSIILPLQNAVIVAQSIAANDLTLPISTSGRDEPAQLLQALASMQGNLRNTLGDIEKTADQLASAAEEMTRVMEHSRQSLQEQNNQINQAATAVNQMSAAVEEVAGNAVTTSEQSQTSTQTAEHGKIQLGETITLIDALVNQVQRAAMRAETLSEQSRGITKVLDVIRSVSEQTNLLALNAAIEAARAGEAGRGFAVVADEVRALAHRTGESTREIESMIGMVQQGTTDTVEALKASVTQATGTLLKAGIAEQALHTITQAVGGINERNLIIATAAEEQAYVAREIDRNLMQIRDLCDQTATAANQTSAAGSDLARLASGLNLMLSTFKL